MYLHAIYMQLFAVPFNFAKPYIVDMQSIFTTHDYISPLLIVYNT